MSDDVTTPDEAEVVEGTAEDVTPEQEAAEPSGELVHLPTAASGAIIKAEQPDEIIAKATTIANALKRLIDSQNMAVNVGGRKKHVEVGAWQACGVMLGALGGEALHAETVWTRPVRDPETGGLVKHHYTVKETTKRKNGDTISREYEVDGHDWEACVEVKTAAGIVVGRAEAMVSRAESTWATRSDPANRSMAETRAESRAYRRAIGWIVAIAGYNPTPAEEMPPHQADPPAVVEASPELKQKAEDAIAYLGGHNATLLATKIVAANDGKLPASVATALVYVEAAQRAGEAAAA